MRVIDMTNPLDVGGGAELQRQASPMARNIAWLKHRLKQQYTRVIHVNDNFAPVTDG